MRCFSPLPQATFLWLSAQPFYELTERHHQYQSAITSWFGDLDSVRPTFNEPAAYDPFSPRVVSPSRRQRSFHANLNKRSRLQIKSGGREYSISTPPRDQRALAARNRRCGPTPELMPWLCKVGHLKADSLEWVPVAGFLQRIKSPSRRGPFNLLATVCE
jgi:hypothetical protein